MEWKGASEMQATGDLAAVAREMAARMPRKNPVLPFKGEHGILTRYFHEEVVKGGKGNLMFAHMKFFGCELTDSIEHLGVEHTETGIYKDEGDSTWNLFVNMGSGAVIFEDLPKNDGPIKINYYGDTLGFRDVDITPFPIASEILRDLNEAFKMMQKYWH